MRQRLETKTWSRNLECEMTNAFAQPTTRTCTAWSYDKAECIPVRGGGGRGLGFLEGWGERGGS